MWRRSTAGAPGRRFAFLTGRTTTSPRLRPILSPTSSSNATLTVGPGGTFTWGTNAAQRWGWTAFKWKLDGGPWSSEIVVSNPPPFTNLPTITLSNLASGSHTVYVSGRNDVGYY